MLGAKRASHKPISLSRLWPHPLFWRRYETHRDSGIGDVLRQTSPYY
jgi:hypothetical protein